MFWSSPPGSFSYPAFTRMALQFGPSLGIEVEVVDSRHGYLIGLKKQGQIKYLLADTNPFNSHQASRLARDKAYTNMLLAHHGLPLARGNYFFFAHRFTKQAYEAEKSVAQALEFGSTLGYPLILKPNGSSMGKGISLVFSQKELETALGDLDRDWPQERIFLLEEFVPGREIRVFILDEEPILTLEKRPFSLLGNGVDDAKTLMNRQWEKLDLGREKMDWSQWENHLTRQNLSWDSILQDGEEVILNEVTYNLHRGATAREIKQPDKATLAICQRALDILGLRYGALDLKIDDGGAVLAILEINSNGGFYRFAQMGPREKQRAEEVFCHLLQKIF